MLTSEARALVTEIQDRLIDLYVQQDEARGNKIRTERVSYKSKLIRPQRSGRRSGPGRLRERSKIREDWAWQKHRHARKDGTCARKPPSITSSGMSTSRRHLTRHTLSTAPPRVPACRSRIRSARSGTLARAAFRLFGDKTQITTVGE